MYTAIAIVALFGAPSAMHDQYGPHQTLAACEARIEALHRAMKSVPGAVVVHAECKREGQGA